MVMLGIKAAADPRGATDHRVTAEIHYIYILILI